MADISRIQDGLYMGSSSFDWDDVWREFDVVVTLISVAQWGKPPKKDHQIWMVYPMQDGEGLPPERDLMLLADFVAKQVKQGKNVLVHCGAGLNRSGLVTTYALLKLRPELSGREAVDIVRKQRGPLAICNPWFERWLVDSFPKPDQTAKQDTI
jgi:protein-tyrosine phosphatase